MKFLVFSALLVVVLAEPPRFNSRFRFERQELTPSTTDSATEPTTESGYPAAGWKPARPFNQPQQGYQPSGWKPQGQKFTLPKQQLPSTNYGVPDNSYGPPKDIYGPPENTYGAPTTDYPDSTANPEVENLEGPVEVQKSEGQYYVLLPNGQLQKVEFMTENDLKNMAYTAKLKLSDSAPLFLLVA